MSRSSFFPRTAMRLAAAAALLACLAGGASAQYFGRNKVEYQRFDWQVLKTEHFDIHFYPEEEQGVREAARLAERWYGRLSQVFGREFKDRRSIILYADQGGFQQTTVVGGLLGEGTGGVTEGVRERVVLPLTGDFADTDHVLGHELTHVFQYDIIKQPRGRSQLRSSEAHVELPLWFVEGMAEYLSLGRYAPQTAMYLRDALARDALPDVDQLSRDPHLFPYRWGHAFWAYVGGRWGDVVAGRLFARATDLGVDVAVQEVLGIDLKQFSKDWKAAIRDAYGPVIEGRQTTMSSGKRLLPREEKTIDTYISPSLSPDGTQVAFFSTRSLFTFDLYLADARTGEITAKLLAEDADPHLDSLRFLDSAGSWSPDGAKIALAVGAKGKNDLAILDVRSRKIEREIDVPETGQLWSPAWSPDGRSMAVTGSVGGFTDLFLVDLASGTSRRLTHDAYADLQPEWSPDGKSLVFVSDREGGGATAGAGTTYGDIGIWSLDVASGALSQIVAPMPGATQINPRFGPGGKDLYFLSDRAGVSDLYRLSLATKELFRVSHVVTGVTGITRLSPALTVSQRTGQILYSIFTDDRYEIHELDPAASQGDQLEGERIIAARDEAAEARAALLPPQQPEVASIVGEYLANRELPPLPGPEGKPAEVAGYRPRYKLDFLGPAVGVGFSTIGTSFGGDISGYFSDELGQNEVGFTLYGVSGSQTVNEFGAQGYYLNQASRWQWGGQAGHVPYVSAFTTVANGTFHTDQGEAPATIVRQVRETLTEDTAAFVSRYPFSATQRFEFTAGATRVSFKDELEEQVLVGDTVVQDSRHSLPSPPPLQLYQASFALVGDNSYYGFTSPVRGHRYRLEVRPTFGDLQFAGVTADYRRYFFFRPVTVAARGLHYGRYGRDESNPQLSTLYLGDPTLVHGYELGSVGLSECTPVPGSVSGCPEFDRLTGSRLVVANFEVRLPFLGVEGYGVFRVRFLPTDLVLFADAGTAWSKGQTPELRFDRTTPARVPVVSAGVAARVLLGGFAVLEFYTAKPFQRPKAGWVTGFFISPGW